MVHGLNNVTFAQDWKGSLTRIFTVIDCKLEGYTPLSCFVKASYNNTERTSANYADLFVKISESGPMAIVELLVHYFLSHLGV